MVHYTMEFRIILEELNDKHLQFNEFLSTYMSAVMYYREGNDSIQ